MRGAKTIGGSALLVALLGAPGCAATCRVAAPSVATAGLEPSASVTAIGGPIRGGLRQETGFAGMPGPGLMLGIGALLVLASPFILLWVLVATPVRVLSHRK